MESHGPVITRKEARTKGLKRYFTGVPCKHGHISERFVVNCLCYTCRKWSRRSAECRSKPRVSEAVRKAKAQAANSAWRAANPEKARRIARESQAKYALKNPQRHRTEYQKNKHRWPGYVRSYQKKYPERAAAHTAKRRAAQLLATPPWVKPEDFDAIYAMAARVSKCLGIPHEVDHFYPLRGRDGSRGLHVPINLRVIPARLNSRKHNKPPK